MTSCGNLSNIFLRLQSDKTSALSHYLLRSLKPLNGSTNMSFSLASLDLTQALNKKLNFTPSAEDDCSFLIEILVDSQEPTLSRSRIDSLFKCFALTQE